MQMIVIVQSGVAAGIRKDYEFGAAQAKFPASTFYRVSDDSNPSAILGRPAEYDENGTEISPAIPRMTEAQVQAIEEALTPAEMLTRLTGMSIADIQTALGI